MTTGFAAKVFSFTTGFSPVIDVSASDTTVSTVFPALLSKPLKTVSEASNGLSTGLKPGVNEKIL